MKEIKGKLGTMHFEIVEDKFKLYDENKEYIGYVEVATDFLHMEDIVLLPLKLANIEHISEIVDLGFVSNMIFSTNHKDVIYQLEVFYREEDEDFDEEDFYDNDFPVNVVGGNYFIVDFTEL